MALAMRCHLFDEHLDWSALLSSTCQRMTFPFLGHCVFATEPMSFRHGGQAIKTPIHPLTIVVGPMTGLLLKPRDHMSRNLPRCWLLTSPRPAGCGSDTDIGRLGGPPGTHMQLT